MKKLLVGLLILATTPTFAQTIQCEKNLPLREVTLYINVNGNTINTIVKQSKKLAYYNRASYQGPVEGDGYSETLDFEETDGKITTYKSERADSNLNFVSIKVLNNVIKSVTIKEKGIFSSKIKFDSCHETGTP